MRQVLPDIHHIRDGAASAAHGSIILAAFSLAIIILLIEGKELRQDEMSPLVVRPFLLAFVGNLVASFQFVIIESVAVGQEQMMAMIIPATLLTAVATTLMLFGVNLAVLRQFHEAEVQQLAMWLFAIAALSSIAVLGVSTETLFSLHREHAHELRSLSPWLLLLPGPLLVVTLWLIVRRAGLTKTRVGLTKIHNLNLLLAALALTVGVAAFFLAAFMESNTFHSLQHDVLPYYGWVVVMAQWLVSGSCFYILQHFQALHELIPRPKPGASRDSGGVISPF